METIVAQNEAASIAVEADSSLSAPPLPQKPINTILLDSTPLLTNTPPLSTLLSHATNLLSTPSVIAEIRDEAARSRVDTLYLPFLTLCTPKPESIKIVRDFARRTGDLSVLSSTDIEVLGLAYEVECELNKGDWRLRRTPGQKRTNGAMPGKEDKQEEAFQDQDAKVEPEVVADTREAEPAAPTPRAPWAKVAPQPTVAEASEALEKTTLADSHAEEERHRESLVSDTTPSIQPHPSDSDLEVLEDGEAEDGSSGDDSEGWITPSNINKRKAKDAAANNTTSKTPGTMQIATITGDFAMQNVLLQMNLNLLSPSTCQRITNLKRTILRCHACFTTTKQMDRQFCDRCGKPALTRVTCTTNANGETKLHLKANMQWNNKGNVFSIPKPVHGTANQKYKGPKHGGGGKNGWGNDLILAEDQKEFSRAKQAQGRERVRDLMDEDYLPGILTGDRNGAGGRVRVGAGRTVNARKR
jgi:RNA-binding protein NOB1